MSTVTSSIASAASTIAANAPKISRAWYDFSDIHPTPEYLEYQKNMRESIKETLSPLNLSILAILITILYLRARNAAPDTRLGIDPSRPITFRTFTPRSLLRFNGTKSEMNPEEKVYIAVSGKVYDVSPGRNFYGPGGPYENFAGRDATRGLACQSFDEDMLTKNLDGPLDPCADLDEGQLENLSGWVERFNEKYLIVGKLVAFSKTSQIF